MVIKDELSPKFINQQGWSMDVGIAGSGIGTGLCFSFYDEYENDMDSVFIQDKEKIKELRDFLTNVIENYTLSD